MGASSLGWGSPACGSLPGPGSEPLWARAVFPTGCFLRADAMSTGRTLGTALVLVATPQSVWPSPGAPAGPCLGDGPLRAAPGHGGGWGV